ncbi:LOW QUALITY PROTEIN: tektin bundle-interacting protein 1 [Aptenodytes patagonicus]|uniref:LOW QUALITY PROTEIN: tektin bundle-interacting protein 1 n=1 Tax=Aptenodytes patagonicus TaxID=9234 RepID=UPI003FA04F42
MAGLQLSALANEHGRLQRGRGAALGTELGEHSPWVLQGTLETEVLLPLYSDWYIMLWGLRQAPLLKQPVCWKITPVGWSTGLSGRGEEAGDPGTPSPPASPTAADSGPTPSRGEWDPLPPGTELSWGAQRLREVAWWDPIVPTVYPGPCTHWGPFLWQERPVLGKEYVVTGSQSPGALGGSSGYVPLLSFCAPPTTTRDISTRSLLHPPVKAAGPAAVLARSW